MIESKAQSRAEKSPLYIIPNPTSFIGSVWKPWAAAAIGEPHSTKVGLAGATKVGLGWAQMMFAAGVLND